jgi:hypothetical protein
VILPGSCTDDGEYRALRSFNDCAIPEAPRGFVSLIRSVQRERRTNHSQRATPQIPFADLEPSDVSRRQWWLLFRNRVFRSFWKREGKAGDATDSTYEYHLAKACFCCGLNHRQAEAVIVNWRRKHVLNRDPRQLGNAILPKALAEVEPWVERWHAEREAADRLRRAPKTSNAILAAAIGIPRECVKKSMQRLAKDGKLMRTPEGYTLP